MRRHTRLREVDGNRSLYCCFSIATKIGENQVDHLLMWTDDSLWHGDALYCLKGILSRSKEDLCPLLTDRVPRYLDSLPLVADKLLSIAGLLATYLLPDGINPLRRVNAYVHGQHLNSDDDDSFEPLSFNSLSPQEHLVLLTFAQNLVEQMPKAKHSQQDKYRSSHDRLTFKNEICSTIAGGLRRPCARNRRYT